MRHDSLSKRRERGFSLPELLVAIAVFAVIIVAALMMYDRSNRTFKRGMDASNMQQNTRIAFDKLVADMRVAGYDFDRDGIPVGSIGGSNAYQQTDEQFEYIGPSAVTIRANFDYETETTPCGGSVVDNCDNGREKTYENAQFPLVTTGNDEIVTYALVPDRQASIPACDTATNCIQLYADTRVPRKSFPDTGGLDEQVVQIPGVDLCTGGCNNPPYTLYRISLDRASQDFSTGANLVRVPIATNVRSIAFKYYQDSLGTDPLKDVLNTTDVSTGETIKGEGRWQVSSPSGLVAERSVRGKVNSVRITLVGMAESPDFGYVDPTETVASVKNYRKNRLETLVAPRNIQKRGMREQDTIPPGAPSITNIYTGRCGIVYLTWTAPPVTTTQGAPDQYKIIYGPTAGSGFPFETTTFTNTFGYVFSLTPNVPYKFEVVALNSYGNRSSTERTATPLNDTKPSAPGSLVASRNLDNKIRLTWNRPTADASGSPGAGAPPAIPPAEIFGYRVERTTDVSGASGWSVIANESAVQSIADVVTWDDTSVLNCTEYRYRVSAVELCNTNNAYNTGNDATKGISAASNVGSGLSTSSTAPSNVPDLTVDQTSACSAGICQVAMQWPKVTTDTAGTAINVGEYRVFRRRRDLGITTWGSAVGTITGAGIPAGNVPVQYTDPNVPIGGGEQYDYMVRAVQCGRESGDSPVRPFPCPFPTGVVGSPAVSANAFNGTGTSGDPWLVAGTPSVTVNISNPSQVARVVGRVYNGSTLLTPTPYTLTAPPYVFSWAIPVDQTNRLDISIVGTGGCVLSYTVYVTEEPQGCCLTPKSSNSTVITYSSGSNFVDIKFINVCGAQLDLQQLNLTFDNALTPGGTKFDTVVFPAQSGGAATVTYNVPSSAGTNISVIPPNGGTAATTAASVPAGSSTYKVRVTFTKTLSNPTQPMSNVTPVYRRPSIDLTNQTCQIVP